MRGALKFVAALAAAFVMMMAFRGLVMTVCTIEDDGVDKVLTTGDRVVVNRWSYGLRTGGEGSLFHYGRICRQTIGRGDLVAFDGRQGRMAMGRCGALPGDTVSVRLDSRAKAMSKIVIPGLATCAGRDYYLIDGALIPEEQIIGRAAFVIYGHEPSAPLWQGWWGPRALHKP